ncbi:galactokinase [Paenibacillus etheri]|uniref:Galactokinase n=1 Tax=Paenibacillus etheri TaxID=1306852 RepID=A0A0W1AXR7_9BACL|nr:galactokinase family protein [Paenibacillus etheri]KTD86134.1 galactokinase [Paenibacillus etheri]
MNKIEFEKALNLTQNAKLWVDLYGENIVEKNKQRYVTAIEKFTKRFHHEDFEVFSAPGRVEIGGNHTDHNGGKILAGSINLDCIGIATKTKQNYVSIVSENYQLDFSINIDDLSSEHEGSTIDLLKGLLAGFKETGKNLGGFDVYVTSNVLSAAGVSSSASFEMLICSILDHFFNENRLSKTEYAMVGKYAENHFWNKDSGLLDQMACAVGGIINIDFQNEDNPAIKNINFDFNKVGYEIIIVNTGKGHADLSEEYSSVPKEMKQVATYFGKSVLAELKLEDIISNLKSLRNQVSDRAILRAIHFFNENTVVEKQIESLESGNFNEFLTLVSASGNSSWKLLQNCYSMSNITEQVIPIALELTQQFISKIGKGATRVHGGGFAGVIMAIIPKENTKDYIEYIEANFLENSTYSITIRPYGAVKITGLMRADNY